MPTNIDLLIAGLTDAFGDLAPHELANIDQGDAITVDYLTDIGADPHDPTFLRGFLVGLGVGTALGRELDEPTFAAVAYIAARRIIDLEQGTDPPDNVDPPPVA